MKPSRKTEHPTFFIVCSVLGGVLCLTIVAIPIGLPLLAIGVAVGSFSKKVWRCTSCDTVFEPF